MHGIGCVKGHGTTQARSTQPGASTKPTPSHSKVPLQNPGDDGECGLFSFETVNVDAGVREWFVWRWLCVILVRTMY
jgi:hypothetical protein